MKTLTITWQRLVDGEGQTCPRCQGTHEELEKAIVILEHSLQPLGIKPDLQTEEIDSASFQKNPILSNRISIEGRPLEEWLGGQVESSSCCSVCGDAECRTIELGSESFEVIPSELILQAALLAASRLLGQNDLSHGERPPGSSPRSGVEPESVLVTAADQERT